MLVKGVPWGIWTSNSVPFLWEVIAHPCRTFDAGLAKSVVDLNNVRPLGELSITLHNHQRTLFHIYDQYGLWNYSCHERVISKSAWWLLMARCLFHSRTSATLMMTLAGRRIRSVLSLFVSSEVANIIWCESNSRALKMAMHLWYSFISFVSFSFHEFYLWETKHQKQNGTTICNAINILISLPCDLVIP